MFSAGHPDTLSSHCSPHFPIPCSLFTQILPNRLAYMWPSGRLLEPAPSLQSLMDSLVSSFTVIISSRSYLCLTHFLYKYSLWKTNLSRCSLDKACSWSLCFTVHSIASHLFLFVGKKDKSVIAHVQLVLWGKPEGIGAKEVYSERVTPEEKGDVRKSGASPMGPMGVKMGWGRWGGRLSTTVTDQSSLGDILDQNQLQSAALNSCLNTAINKWTNK